MLAEEEVQRSRRMRRSSSGRRRRSRRLPARTRPANSFARPFVRSQPCHPRALPRPPREHASLRGATTTNCPLLHLFSPLLAGRRGVRPRGCASWTPSPGPSRDRSRFLCARAPSAAPRTSASRRGATTSLATTGEDEDKDCVPGAPHNVAPDVPPGVLHPPAGPKRTRTARAALAVEAAGREPLPLAVAPPPASQRRGRTRTRTASPAPPTTLPPTSPLASCILPRGRRGRGLLAPLWPSRPPPEAGAQPPKQPATFAPIWPPRQPPQAGAQPPGEDGGTGRRARASRRWRGGRRGAQTSPRTRSRRRPPRWRRRWRRPPRSAGARADPRRSGPLPARGRPR